MLDPPTVKMRPVRRHPKSFWVVGPWPAASHSGNVRSRWIPALRLAALLAVTAVAVANVIHTVRKTPPAALGVSAAAFDPLSWHEQRFQRFRAAAAARGLRGTIGYIGDRPAADDDYFYAQFALVPLLLDFDPAPYEWAIANLRTTSPGSRVPAGWRIVQDLGDGVLLLRKSAP